MFTVNPRLLAFMLSLLIALITWLGVPVQAIALSLSPMPFPATGTVMSTGGFFPFFAGKAPTNLGVQEGQLATCPASPNCVSSQSQDAKHFIAPIPFSAQSEDPLKQLKAIVQELPRTNIVAETDRYLYAQFTSSLMGFVDDVEFYLDPEAKVIQVRSASRLGESDLGVNRKRIEMIRNRLNGI
jgi:uncharacterized protein (DUF1499 family)